MRIALDAMGGDHAAETVAGAVAAAREYGVEVALVGRTDAIAAELAKHTTTGLTLPIVEAPDIIEMDEHPANAARRKPNSSINIALRQVREGHAAAMISAGNSAGPSWPPPSSSSAVSPASSAPAIGAVLPSGQGRVL
ncbi:MAG: hypothetical protein U0841_23170 [Chloroflexia bacterium]